MFRTQWKNLSEDVDPPIDLHGLGIKDGTEHSAGAVADSLLVGTLDDIQAVLTELESSEISRPAALAARTPGAGLLAEIKFLAISGLDAVSKLARLHGFIATTKR